MSCTVGLLYMGFKSVFFFLVVVVVGGSFSSCAAFVWKGLCVDKSYSLGFVSFVLCPEVIVCVCGWDGWKFLPHLWVGISFGLLQFSHVCLFSVPLKQTATNCYLPCPESSPEWPFLSPPCFSLLPAHLKQSTVTPLSVSCVMKVVCTQTLPS